MSPSKSKTVDEYIQAAPEHAREKLNELRSLLKSVAPNASEGLKWGQPVLMERRILFSYAAFKNHLTWMPTGPAIIPFSEELSTFKTGKDTIQFPYDRPLPTELIKKIATFRYRDVIENDARWMY
ncbi:iron chaperone [Parapedobacter pyrenivorans]|uniref:iron chaperone n=1 Tax=Parapedobacter pyrenivorans TaxID=1305674 RepID=UPI00333E592E